MTIAPTPPPDIDVEAWDASLDLIAAWKPASLGLTHFGGDRRGGGAAGGDARLAARARASWRSNAGAGHRRRGASETASTRTGDRFLRAAYAAAVPPEHIYQGLERYWRKRAEREADRPVGVAARAPTAVSCGR